MQQEKERLEASIAELEKDSGPAQDQVNHHSSKKSKAGT